ARTSVMSYKKKEKNVSEIGKELRVGTVLEGSVRKAGNKVRVTAQLIDVPTESHLWSEKYDRELDDIFKIQDDISEKIAGALRVKLVSVQGPAGKHAESIDAYMLYLKGRSLWNRREKMPVLESLKLFQEAISMDPDYAKAYSGLADAYFVAATYGFMDVADGLVRSKEAATKALELDDTLAEAHASLGLDLYQDLRYEDALREFRRAIELNPNYASAHQWYSQCLLDVGRAKEAMEEIEKAHELDPLSPIITHWLGSMNYYDGRVDEAIAILDKLIEKEPTFAGSYGVRAACFMWKGMKERARADMEAYHRVTGDEDGYKGGLAWIYLLFGEREKALPLIEEFILKVGTQAVMEWNIAEWYAALGDRDESFNWIDKALVARRISLAELRYCPGFANVR